MSRINKKKFEKAMEGSGGILANIARKLNVSRQAVSIYVQNHKEVRLLLDQEDENINDLAEAKLITKLNEGDMQAIKFRLTTKAKNRGYVDKQELELSGDVNIVTAIVQAYQERKLLCEEDEE